MAIFRITNGKEEHSFSGFTEDLDFKYLVEGDKGLEKVILKYGDEDEFEFKGVCQLIRFLN